MCYTYAQVRCHIVHIINQQWCLNSVLLQIQSDNEDEDVEDEDVKDEDVEDDEDEIEKVAEQDEKLNV